MRRPIALLAAAWTTLAVGPPAVAADAVAPPDLCLAVGLERADPMDVDAIVGALGDALATRPVLIPAPSILPVVSDLSDGSHFVRVPAWSDAATAPAKAARPGDVPGLCGDDVPAGSWAAAIAGEFLRAGTKRELAAQRTTPGFTSAIDVTWDDAADRVRTVLTFSGPFDIPNGTCWMDDVVSADGQGGTHAETTTDSQTSPFGDGVCGRFDEYLSNGGAGAQALVLLPREIGLPGGRVLRLSVDGVDVDADAIRLWGDVVDDES